MSSVIEGPARDQVQWLASAGPEVIGQFLTIAQESLVRQLDRKVFTSAAKKLSMSSEQIEQTIEALGYLLTNIAGGTITDTSLPFNTELKEAAAAHISQLRTMVSASSLQDPLNTSFVDLDWRLDVTVASRNNPENIKPRILLKIVTRTADGGEKEDVIQCDYANFKHLYQELTRAMESTYSVLAKKTEKFLPHSKYV